MLPRQQLWIVGCRENDARLALPMMPPTCQHSRGRKNPIMIDAPMLRSRSRPSRGWVDGSLYEDGPREEEPGDNQT
jgi:hypothetical protein